MKGEPMGDCMNFPDTVEEFMEQYKMTDAKQVYSNGIEYVPIFRMKQWFEHEKDQPTAQPETTYEQVEEYCKKRCLHIVTDDFFHTAQPSTSDLISRQAVINAIENTNAKMSMPEWDEITNAVMSLPTIQPEPQEGHWIPHETPDGGKQYECSRCGVLWEFNDGTPEDNEAYYCPKCGKKLITK